MAQLVNVGIVDSDEGVADPQARLFRQAVAVDLLRYKKTRLLNALHKHINNALGTPSSASYLSDFAIIKQILSFTSVPDFISRIFSERD